MDRARGIAYRFHCGFELARTYAEFFCPILKLEGVVSINSDLVRAVRKISLLHRFVRDSLGMRNRIAETRQFQCFWEEFSNSTEILCGFWIRRMHETFLMDISDSRSNGCYWPFTAVHCTKHGG